MAFHSSLSGSNIDSKELIVGITVVVAGYIVIDPFGVNFIGIRIFLWLGPWFFTLKCLCDDYRAVQKEGAPLSLSAFNNARTVKWVDYWVTSTGLSCIGWLLRFLERMAGESYLDTVSKTSVGMLTLQTGLLLWWITGNQAGTEPQDASAATANRNPSIHTKTSSMHERTRIDDMFGAIDNEFAKTVMELQSPSAGKAPSSTELIRNASAPSDLPVSTTRVSLAQAQIVSPGKINASDSDSLESPRSPTSKREIQHALLHRNAATRSDNESPYSQPSGYETDLSILSATSSSDSSVKERRAPSNPALRASPSSKAITKPSVSLNSRAGDEERPGRRSRSTSSSNHTSSIEFRKPDGKGISKSKAKPSPRRTASLSSTSTISLAEEANVSTALGTMKSRRKAMPDKANSSGSSPSIASSAEESEKPSTHTVNKSKAKPANPLGNGRRASSSEDLLTEVIPRPRPFVSVDAKKESEAPQPRASRILAQLDDILLAELNELGRSPGGLTTNTASDGQEAATPVTEELRRLQLSVQRPRERELSPEGRKEGILAKQTKRDLASMKPDVSLIPRLSPSQVGKPPFTSL
jgi:hypothetical protein